MSAEPPSQVDSDVKAWAEAYVTGGSQTGSRIYNNYTQTTHTIVRLMQLNTCWACRSELEHVPIDMEHEIPFAKGGSSSMDSIHALRMGLSLPCHRAKAN